VITTAVFHTLLSDSPYFYRPTTKTRVHFHKPSTGRHSSFLAEEVCIYSIFRIYNPRKKNFSAHALGIWALRAPEGAGV
jgi:hypothetical protein